MRIASVLVVLVLAGCAGAYHTPSDGRLQTRINQAYAARDACLERNAAADVANAGVATSLAQTVAAACISDTDKLIEVINRDGDPRVAAAIRRDSEFRATSFLLKARGEAPK